MGNSASHLKQTFVLTASSLEGGYDTSYTLASIAQPPQLKGRSSVKSESLGGGTFE